MIIVSQNVIFKIFNTYIDYEKAHDLVFRVVKHAKWFLNHLDVNQCLLAS